MTCPWFLKGLWPERDGDWVKRCSASAVVVVAQRVGLIFLFSTYIYFFRDSG